MESDPELANMFYRELTVEQQEEALRQCKLSLLIIYHFNYEYFHNYMMYLQITPTEARGG